MGCEREENHPALVLPSSCFIDEHVTRVAWLNRSNILYAGNDRWTSDPRVRLLTNTPEEFSILITQVGLGDEGLYTCSFQTRRQPYTTQVYLIVHGEPSAAALGGGGRDGPGGGRRGQGTLMSSPIPGAPPWEGRHTPCPHEFQPSRGRESHRQLLGQESYRAERGLGGRLHSFTQPCFWSTCYLQALLRGLGTEKESGRLSLPL